MVLTQNLLLSIKVNSKKSLFEYLAEHAEFVCYYSPVLNAAFNSSFQEGLTQTYYMVDTEIDAFRIFIQWCYAQKLDTELLLEKYLAEGASTDRDLSPQQRTRLSRIKIEEVLYHVCFLADKLMVPQLYNCAIKALENIFTRIQGPYPGHMEEVWACTDSKSSLRKLLLDTWAWYAYTKKWPRQNDEFPQEMLVELVKVLGAKASHGETNKGFLIFRSPEGYCLPWGPEMIMDVC